MRQIVDPKFDVHCLKVIFWWLSSVNILSQPDTEVLLVSISRTGHLVRANRRPDTTRWVYRKAVLCLKR